LKERTILVLFIYHRERPTHTQSRDREMEGDKGPVCVTGGTGFIGSWLIKRLLDRGYYVRTTVRSDAGKPLNRNYFKKNL
jgi:FlaA1/EpsC-like NDP-sugar epimerase